MWQDVVLAGGSIVFIIALFPSVFSKNKPALSTSLTTGSVLLIFVFVYASLSLWFAMVSTSITSFVWFVLAFQKINRNK